MAESVAGSIADLKAIDMHAHFGSHDRGDGQLVARMRSGDIDVVRRRAAASNVVITVVSCLQTFHPYGGDIIQGNEAAAQAAAEHKDIRFWAVLDPMRKETYRQVESLLCRRGCAGIKIHPVNHRYEIRERGDEIFEFAAAHAALVLTHSGCVNSFPEDFIPFANRYPAVRLILGHLGNSADGIVTRQVYALMRAEAGNVYTDTSSAMSINCGLIEWAVEQAGADRILFGSDSPLYSVAAHRARIEYAEMADCAKRAVLYENAAHLLRMAE